MSFGPIVSIVWIMLFMAEIDMIPVSWNIVSIVSIMVVVVVMAEIDMIPVSWNTEFLNRAHDLFHNIVRIVQAVLDYTPEERAAQEEKRKQRKLKMRQYQERQQAKQASLNRQRREYESRTREGVESCGTDLSEFITLMKEHSAPKIAISENEASIISNLYRDWVKTEPSMEALLKQCAPKYRDTSYLATHLKKVHEIFRYENFAPESSPANLLSMAPVIGELGVKHAYQAMRPALQLATKFLLAPEMEGYWFRIMYGRPMTGFDRKPFLARSPLEDDVEQARKDFRGLLEVMQDRLTFGWCAAENVDASFHSSIWTAIYSFERQLSPMIAKRSKVFNRITPYRYSGHIALHVNLLAHLLDGSSPSRKSMDAYLKLQTHLAVTITHELSHAIYRFCLVPWPEMFVYPVDILNRDIFGRPVYTPEVTRHCQLFSDLAGPEKFIFTTDPINEVGWSFENFLWEGFLLVTTTTSDDIRTEACEWSDAYQTPSLRIPVDPQWLRELFHEKTWAAFRKHTGKLGQLVKHPNEFFVHRYIKPRGYRGYFKRIHYKDGLPQGGDEADLLRLTEYRVPGDVREWHRGIRKLDVKEALKTGRYYEQTFVNHGPGAWTRGSVVVIVKKVKGKHPAPEEGEAPWLKYL